MPGRGLLIHDEIESVARAFYCTNEDGRGWEREPEILKEGFRIQARLAINVIDGFHQRTSLPTPRLAQSAPPGRDLIGFLAVLSGPEHVYHMANKAHQRLTGHRALINRPVREAVPELKEHGYFDLLDEVYETGQPFFGNLMPLRIRTRRNGPLEDRLIDLAYKPIIGGSGQRIGIMVEGRDVTEGLQLST